MAALIFTGRFRCIRIFQPTIWTLRANQYCRIDVGLFVWKNKLSEWVWLCWFFGSVSYAAVVATITCNGDDILRCFPFFVYSFHFRFTDCLQLFTTHYCVNRLKIRSTGRLQVMVFGVSINDVGFENRIIWYKWHFNSICIRANVHHLIWKLTQFSLDMKLLDAFNWVVVQSNSMILKSSRVLALGIHASYMDTTSVDRMFMQYRKYVYRMG